MPGSRAQLDKRCWHSHYTTMRNLAVLLFAVGLCPGLASSTEPREGVAILQKRCSTCHGGQVTLSGLDLTSRESTLRGGQRGPAVVPGDAEESRLVHFVRREAEPAMPPTGAIPAEEVAALEKWVNEGFEWPQGTTDLQTPPSTWWAFQKPQRPAVPNGATGSAAIDAFVDQGLNEQNLQPSDEADPRTLIRRASFDLHGLPPSPAEIESLVADGSADAWPQLVERLLASPRYGEKWGRHWLDLVRYGDTAGFETDPYHLDAWRYRDYVIKSFNEDKPYDRFIREQIAGDELWPEDADAGTATALFRVGPHRDLQVKIEEQNRIEKLSDYVATTSEVFLGLSVGCARCHDHKFDPIPQRDYYRVQAIFEPIVNTRHMLQPLALLDEVNKTKREFQLYQIGAQLQALYAPYEQLLRREKLENVDASVLIAFETLNLDRTPAQEALVNEYADRARVSDAEVLSAMSDGDKERLEGVRRRLFQIFKGYGPGPFVDGITDSDARFPDSYIWLRGNPESRGETVRPGFLSALGGGDIPEAPEGSKTTGRRTALAEWLVDQDNPLTARVMVNRIWQYHFGRGLVATPSDFGVRAQKPAQPELLDWLAVEFMESGWSIKHMHRLIMNTRSYRRTAIPSEAAAAKDPENVYLSHYSRRRLSAEEVRDSVLKASGSLNLKMGGLPAVPPLQPEELYGIIGGAESAWPVSPDPAEHFRRSIYLLSRRTFTQPMFAAFDKPDGIASCPRRSESTTAPQSLTLLNSEFMVEQSRLLARVAEDVDDLWRRSLGRTPNAQEREWVEAFLVEQGAVQGSRAAAEAELARALLNLNEFLYVE